MTRGLVFNLTPFRSSGSSTDEVSKAQWLRQVLPDFGVVQLTGGRADAIQVELERRVEGDVVHWRSSEQFSSFPELLADTLNLATVDHAYLQHSLRKWAENEGMLWLIVDGERLSADLLMQMKAYAPLSKKGQFAIRIILRISDDRLHSKAFQPLLSIIHEHVGNDELSTSQAYAAPTVLSRPHLLLQYKAWLVWFVSVTVIAAGILLTPQEPISTPRSMAEKEPPLVEANKEIQWIETVEVRPLVEAVSPAETVDVVSLHETREILAFIKQWSMAWQTRNLEAYFSMYADGYSAYSYMQPSEWREWRQKRLKKPAWISVEIGPVSIVRNNKDEMLASFWQLYRSDGYQDNTLKALSLREEGGIWKIIGETNQEVRPLSKE